MPLIRQKRLVFEPEASPVYQTPPFCDFTHNFSRSTTTTQQLLHHINTVLGDQLGCRVTAEYVLHTCTMYLTAEKRCIPYMVYRIKKLTFYARAPAHTHTVAPRYPYP